MMGNSLTIKATHFPSSIVWAVKCLPKMMKMSHLSAVPLGGSREDASNDETSLLNSSQIFSFPGPISSPVTLMTWFKREVLPWSYNIPCKPISGSGTQVMPPMPVTSLLVGSLLCHSIWQPHHTLTHANTPTPFLKMLLLSHNSIHLSQDFPGAYTPSGILGYEKPHEMVKKTHYKLPTANFPVTNNLL